MILAAGAVLWRRSGDGMQVAVVHRPRYDDWSLPKGKLDPGESLPFAAVREIAEETGYVAHLRNCLGDVTYDVPEGPKRVRYWSAQAAGGTFEPNDETDELRWCAVADAAGLLTYRRDVDVLDRFAAVGPPDSMVLLVRHAKAGSRSQWTADDDLRPLSGTGREQARHLASFLALFGPDRLASAPPVRCRDTIAPLAKALGLPVADEPLLGEDGYWDNLAAGRARLHELAASSGVTAVCSQGGVIPDVISKLSSNQNLNDPPDAVSSRKGSTWTLTFTNGAPRTFDYFDGP